MNYMIVIFIVFFNKMYVCILYGNIYKFYVILNDIGMFFLCLNKKKLRNN